MDVKEKKIIGMHKHNLNLEKKMIIFFLFCILNMVCYTILIIPLYKYICSISDDNTSLVSLLIENKVTRLFYWHCIWSNEIYLGLSWFKEWQIKKMCDLVVDVDRLKNITFLSTLNSNVTILLNSNINFHYQIDLPSDLIINLNYFYLLSTINDSLNLFLLLITDLKINVINHYNGWADSFKLLSTTTNNENDYNSLIKNHKWFQLVFLSKIGNLGFLEFKTLQETIIVIPGETVLVFFRLYNPTGLNLTCLSYYLIFPNNYTIYVSKLQCFCFDTILINSFESIDLPVLFFLDSMIIKDVNIYNRLYLYYLILLKN